MWHLLFAASVTVIRIMKLRKRWFIAVFAPTVGVSTMVSATTGAGVECDRVRWATSAGQNHYARLRYLMCLRRNHGPMSNP